MSERVKVGTCVLMIVIGFWFVLFSQAEARNTVEPPTTVEPPQPLLEFDSASVVAVESTEEPAVMDMPSQTALDETPHVNAPDLADTFTAEWLFMKRPLPHAPAPINTMTATPSPEPRVSVPTPTAVSKPIQPVKNQPTTGKWIDINIAKQTITAYLGSTPVKSVLVSTGTAAHPTVIGKYQVYAKIPSQTMTGGSRARGDYYSLPNVTNVMYFYAGYGIHGTYWHRNFGHPMSHGCINLTLEDAKWFYDWTPMATTVVTHY